MKLLKTLAARALATPPLARWAPLLAGRATIFMMHRFAVPDLGVSGHDPEVVRSALEYLRRRKYHFATLTELLDCLERGEPMPERTIVFTIDDGYFDQAEIAAPLFAEFDCSATCFVCTGFVDGELWMWWDQIEHA